MSYSAVKCGVDAFSAAPSLRLRLRLRPGKSIYTYWILDISFDSIEIPRSNLDISFDSNSGSGPDSDSDPLFLGTLPTQRLTIADVWMGLYSEKLSNSFNHQATAGEPATHLTKIVTSARNETKRPHNMPIYAESHLDLDRFVFR